MGAITQWWRLRRRRTAEHAIAARSFDAGFAARAAVLGEHDAGHQADASLALLEAANNRLKLYFDRAPLACIVYGADRVVRAWNPAAEAMFGYSAAEAIGRSVYDLVATPGGIDVVRARMSDGATYPEGVTIENRRKDGSRLHCHWHFSRIAEGTADECVISLGSDVTAQVQAERQRELTQANLREAQKMQSLDTFAGGIAHDFNNILLAIRGNARLATDDLPADHPAQVSLAEVGKACARAAVIVNQILALHSDEAASGLGADDIAATANAAAYRGKGQSILYVDDEEALVYLITRVLERLGYRVAGFTDARVALAEFQANPAAYEAVVTDLSMPGMSGVEFSRQVLQIRPELPVVMTSGYVRPEDRESVLETGVRDLLLKPNTVEELGEVLHRLVGGMTCRRSV